MSAPPTETDADRLIRRVGSGELLAVAHAISAVENRTPLGIELGVALRGRRSSCHVLGVTGPPGAGKSSLISALVTPLLERHSRIGILTVDPSSPVSGGAVLGDRVRMAAHSRNPDVYIRSLAARGHLGGVTRTTRGVIDVLGAAHFDLIIVETVGTGQSEVEVSRLADVKLVVCPPGLGDEMQAIKAGILEIADFLIVNKADLPDAARTAGHLTAMLHHRGHDETRQVLLASAVTGTGLGALVEAIDRRLSDLDGKQIIDRSGTELVEALAHEAAELVRVFIRDTDDDRIDDVCRAIDRGEITLRDGAVSTIAAFLRGCDAATRN